MIRTAVEMAVPVPCLMGSLSYLDSLRCGPLPTNLIQAQRDFFGAHSYRRVDKSGTFHTEWSLDRSESSLEAGEAQVLPPEPPEKADQTPA